MGGVCPTVGWEECASVDRNIWMERVGSSEGSSVTLGTAVWNIRIRDYGREDSLLNRDLLSDFGAVNVCILSAIAVVNRI